MVITYFHCAGDGFIGKIRHDPLVAQASGIPGIGMGRKAATCSVGSKRNW